VVDIGRVDFDVEHVDPGKLLKQDGFAFHNGLGGQRSNRAKAQDGGPVRNHPH